MNRDVGGVGPPAGRERAAAVGLVLAAAVSPQVGAAFAGGSGRALAMAVGALIVLPAGVIQAEGALAEPDLLLAIAMVVVASAGAASHQTGRPGRRSVAP